MKKGPGLGVRHAGGRSASQMGFELPVSAVLDDLAFALYSENMSILLINIKVQMQRCRSSSS